MLQQKFYHSHIRKSIIAFGNLFNNIHIDRKNDAGEVVQTVKVPLAYSPQQPFLAKIRQQPVAEDAKFEVTLPRMSFEMISVQHDPNRKIAPTQTNAVPNNTNTTLTKQYAPAPYNIGMMLYVYSKNQDDALQIVEQILPYFNPDFYLTIKAIPQLNLKHDIPILLDSVSVDDQYEGDFASRRMIVWTFSFTMKLNFYGPLEKQNYIKSVYTNTFSDNNLQNNITTYNVTTANVPGDINITYVESFEDF